MSVKCATHIKLNLNETKRHNGCLTILCINATGQLWSWRHICVDELLYLEGLQSISNGHTWHPQHKQSHTEQCFTPFTHQSDHEKVHP